MIAFYAHLSSLLSCAHISSSLPVCTLVIIDTRSVQPLSPLFCLAPYAYMYAHTHRHTHNTHTHTHTHTQHTHATHTHTQTTTDDRSCATCTRCTHKCDRCRPRRPRPAQKRPEVGAQALPKPARRQAHILKSLEKVLSIVVASYIL